MPTQYAIHSTVRGRHNRTERATLAAHLRTKQYIGDTQQRLVRCRPIFVTEETLLRNLDELKKKQAGHILEVRTTDGRLVDLSTLVPAPIPVTPPLPHPKLDSVADDTPTGIYIPPYVGDDQTSLPDVLPAGQLPQLLQEIQQQEQLEAQDSLPPPPPDAPPADDIDAAVDAAQREASEEVEPQAAPSTQEEVSSTSGGRKGRRNRR